jgi:hydroxymethylglutaryl-CoA lyase
MKEKVKIFEVGLRDGLQNENRFVATKSKKELLDLLLDSGLKNIELTSFVRKDKIPQLADSEDFSKLVNFRGGNTYSALVPNLKGLEKAVELGYSEIAIFGACSETFLKKNINLTISESIKQFQEVITEAFRNNIRVRGYVSTIVACPYEGKIDSGKVIDLVKIFFDLGVYEVSLGETIGVAVPNDIENLLSRLVKVVKPNLLSGHFHDTYGMALANVSKSIEFGIRTFDSSFGGIGGCPYAKGASGNLATEDLVYLLENSNFDTGVNLDKLIKASILIEQILEKPLLSKTYLARKKILL